MSKVFFNIEVPFFPGFYESALYNCDTLYYETEDADSLEHYREVFGDDTLESDDLDIDFPRYKEDCCKAYVEGFDSMAPDFVKSAVYSDMTSPRYYNFETDRVYADVEFEEDWRDKVLAFMAENEDWLTKRIREDWSDRDGFWSYMDNRYSYWVDMFKEDDVDTRYISTMLGYMLYKENENIRWDLIESVLNDIYVGCYIINTKEKDND